MRPFVRISEDGEKYVRKGQMWMYRNNVVDLDESIEKYTKAMKLVKECDSKLKNIEEQSSNMGLIRCHRFYMVNSNNVKLLRKTKDGLLLELDTDILCEIPVSKTYLSAVSDFFSN